MPRPAVEPWSGGAMELMARRAPAITGAAPGRAGLFAGEDGPGVAALAGVRLGGMRLPDREVSEEDQHAHQRDPESPEGIRNRFGAKGGFWGRVMH